VTEPVRADVGSEPGATSMVFDPTVDGGRKIRRHRAEINAALEHGLSNALIESTNTKILVLTRMAYGFKSPEALIALAMLSLGGHRPDLPGRTTAA
ncbi:MAG: transposase, partial [Ilumatobacteraceae bacterium]